jgi:ADP-heptose:LPS heptosyltransferase
VPAFLKRAERSGRIALLRAAARVVLGRRRVDPPDWDARLYRVLYVRHEAIGDMIMATGLLRALARAHPTVRLEVLTFPSHATVLEGNPHVHAVIPVRAARRRTYSAGLLRDLRERRYDVVIDGLTVLVRGGIVRRQEVMPRTITLMLALRPAYRVGLAGRPGDFVYNLPATVGDLSGHHIETSAALAKPFGVDPSAVDLRPEIHLSDRERRNAEARWRALAGDATRLLVNISTADPDRRWPPERFVSVLRALRELDARVGAVVIGAPGDEHTLARVSEASGWPWTAPGLREAFALVAHADCLLTPNTSIAHAASAFQRPTVVLQPAMYESYVPYRTPGAVVTADHATVAGIGPERVLSAVREVLELYAPAVRGDGLR